MWHINILNITQLFTALQPESYLFQLLYLSCLVIQLFLLIDHGLAIPIRTDFILHPCHTKHWNTHRVLHQNSVQKALSPSLPTPWGKSHLVFNPIQIHLYSFLFSYCSWIKFNAYSSLVVLWSIKRIAVFLNCFVSLQKYLKIFSHWFLK